MDKNYNTIREFTDTVKKDNIFPWLYKDNKDIQGMIISPDTDGFISALLLNEIFNWQVVGFYDGKALVTLLGEKELKLNKDKYIFVDIEILRPEIKSCGHHILLYDIKEKNNLITQTENTCLQPNNWRNKDVKNNFNTKYPFGTFHLLLSILYNLYPENELFNFDFSKAMIPSIYIDGVFKNLFNYPENCLDWLKYLTNDNPDHPFEKILRHPTTPKDLMLLMDNFFDKLNDVWKDKQQKSRGKISLNKDIDGDGNLKQNIIGELKEYLQYLASQYNFSFKDTLWPVIFGNLNVLPLFKGISNANSKSNYNKIINKKPLNFAITSKARKGLEYTLDKNKIFG